MFDKSQAQRGASKLRVIVRYAGERGVDGWLFARQGERLSDLLNDDRAFLPFQTLAGEMRSISKSAIVDVREARENGVASGDPYELLGVAEDAAPEEVKAAYLKRLKAAHPDRLEALKLDPMLVDAAKRLSQDLNNAYDAIARARRSAA